MSEEMRQNYQSLEFCKVSNKLEVKFNVNTDEL